MLLRSAVRLHTWLTTALAGVLALVLVRLRTAPQRGQGTVEYVALILLVAAVLAAAVTVAGKGQAFDLKGTVTKQLTNAIETVGGKSPHH